MVVGFVKAVLSGTVAASLIPWTTFAAALFSLPPAGSDLPGISKAFLWITSVAFVLVLLSAAIVGVPTTLLLRRWNSESGFAYVIIGVITGLAVTALVAGVLTGDPVSALWSIIPFGLLGAFGGGVTGYAWWQVYRRRMVEGILLPE
jgi:hypothetical protein